MSYQITNYHSKAELVKAVLAGKKVKILPIPLSKEQKKQNEAWLAEDKESPNVISPDPQPFGQYEVFCAANKEVPVWEAIVWLSIDCYIVKVI